jgi:putative endonuclease
LGRWGEQEAASYLTGQGYEILERNHRTPHGELDLIARLPAANTIVFVEVKTRSTRTFGYPEASVDAGKQAHLLNAAQYYIQQHPDLTCNWRIDVIAIQRARQGGPAQITHFENAL